MNYPKSLCELINCLKMLPTIGDKSAERLAFAIMNLDEESINNFSLSIINVKNKIKKCKNCGNITEDDLCSICNDKSRNIDTICVVENPKNIISLEKIGNYNGLYFVLNGLISPMNGIGPLDIGINLLINKVKENNITEVIVAISPTLEGETTALYIARALSSYDVNVTRIAYGIPMGADMEYLDSTTLSLAFSNRNKIS